MLFFKDLPRRAFPRWEGSDLFYHLFALEVNEKRRSRPRAESATRRSVGHSASPLGTSNPVEYEDMLRFFSLLLLIGLASSLCSYAQCSKQLINTWQYSSEESTNDIEVYRPISHQLPPARGRRELIFRSDGSFVQNSIGRNDKRSEVSGTWALIGKHRLMLTVNGQTRTERTIIRCGQDRLVLKRTM